jgi:cell envelope opacity-associated protein A
MNNNIEISDEEKLYEEWFESNVKDNQKDQWTTLLVPCGVTMKQIFLDGFVAGYSYVKKHQS